MQIAFHAKYTEVRVADIILYQPSLVHTELWTLIYCHSYMVSKLLNMAQAMFLLAAQVYDFICPLLSSIVYIVLIWICKVTWANAFHDSIHELATDPLGYCMLLTQFSNYKFRRAADAQKWYASNEDTHWWQRDVIDVQRQNCNSLNIPSILRFIHIIVVFTASIVITDL